MSESRKLLRYSLALAFLTLAFAGLLWDLEWTPRNNAVHDLGPTQIDAADAPPSDPASFVNMFIGTTNGGHVFPGATLPHGMVKVGMDTDSPGNHAGYDADPIYSVTGFSQLHDDGTGGNIPLSNFKIFPSANCSTFETCTTSIFDRKLLRKLLIHGAPDDSASPGYFSTNLSSGVRVELTATRRTSLQRHTFPPSKTGILPRINVDISNDGQMSAISPTVEIDPKTGRVTGGASFQASFGPGRYNAFTCVDFRLASPPGLSVSVSGVSPTEYGVWSDGGPFLNTTSGTQLSNAGSQLGALLSFRPISRFLPTTILVRSGVSFISAEQACSNAEAEIPSFDFESVGSAARAEWNDLLGRVRVGMASGLEDTRELLYSSLYRTHISPADYTEENPSWNSTEPYYDSFYCNWDTYRTLYPLLSLHDPARFALIVRGMINIQQNEGWLPECRGATQQQWVQGGSNGDPILAEFFVKFTNQSTALNVTTDALYNALLADAEKQAPNFDLQGREALAWNTYNFLPLDLYGYGGSYQARTVSRALEYAFDDFSISQVAKILNKTDDSTKYAGRAENFVILWGPNVTVPGGPDSVLGMFQPRYLNGSSQYVDPRHCSANDPTHSTCYLDPNNVDGFYEGSPLLYSQYVPHDNALLIDLQGGPQNFISRLDFIIDNGYFDVTDEPGQQIPFMYHYANRPGLSTQRSRQTIAQFFNLSVDGLPGNDDSGAMGSYAFFNLAGLYPLPATRQLLLSSPYFPSISFYNPVLKSTTTIRVKNFSGNPENGTGGAVFVKSVTIDGKPWKSTCFIDWDVFENGSTVELELTSDISLPCGSTSDTLPPSLSTGGYA
ncbi:glycoside hydrolase family 92 protein [Artomyces pyxidatus]|uniref:Glycoside hydrolase family 92 protein n=1 Tax=Artomyces pyxidatus TaxID=48021 RepID=A0ACB8T0R2_9AGAM|nr:glycoside hydrolase family 92 protein [Artomyces pyxidatus]